MGQLIFNVIGALIAGLIIFAVGYIYYDYKDKFDNIEIIIEEHHTLDLEQAVNRNFITKVKSLESRITTLEKCCTNLKARSDEIEEEIDESIRKENIGNAVFSGTLSRDTCIINTAHPSGHKFKINDDILVVNETSGQQQSSVCKIISRTNDYANRDVLLTVDKEFGKVIGLTETLGKIKVSIEKK